MKKYETIVVFRPNLNEEEIKVQIDNITNIIKDGGHFESIEEWGMRNLAYKIDNQFTEGYYILINFEADTKVLDDLEHYYKVNDTIIRTIIVKRIEKKK